MKRLLLVSSALAVIALGSACTPWPPHGHGGVVEAYYPWHADLDEFASAEARRLAELRKEIQNIRLLGGEDKFPAYLANAQLQWVRTARFCINDMEPETFSNLAILERMTRQMRFWVDHGLQHSDEKMAYAVEEAS
jgi:hypothetical protein